MEELFKVLNIIQANVTKVPQTMATTS